MIALTTEGLAVELERARDARISQLEEKIENISKAIFILISHIQDLEEIIKEKTNDRL